MPERKSYHHGDLKNALIRAGVEILAQEGLHAFSLRKVALRAGVSHSAPYAHFADRQALIAAISTEGFRKLYDQMDQVLRAHEGDPLQQLIEGAWAYLQFAIQDPAHFKITFSGVLLCSTPHTCTKVTDGKKIHVLQPVSGIMRELTLYLLMVVVDRWICRGPSTPAQRQKLVRSAKIMRHIMCLIISSGCKEGGNINRNLKGQSKV